MAGLVRLLKQKWYPPAPETSLFTGRTVLITGATTGLGLEAAKKIVCLEPSTLIITARSKKRGERARDIIQRHHAEKTKSSSTSTLPQVHLLILNMSDFEPVIDFADEIKTKFPTLDTVILNAGLASRTWTVSEDGWEEQLQVNSLSTTLLALLLLPTLLANTPTTKSSSSSSPSATTHTRPHMTIVTSGLARIQKPESMIPYLQTTTPLSQLNTKPTTSPPPPAPTSLSTIRRQYALSKLILETNTKHLAILPLITSTPNPPAIIINTACPGLCATDLSRNMGTSLFLRLLLRFFYMLFGRSAEQGSNTLVSAVTRDIDGHGKMWKDDRYYDAGEFLESVEGKSFGDRVWRDTCEVLEPLDERLGDLLRGSG